MTSEHLSQFLRFIKPYNGIGYSNGNKFKEVCFYDEREWRFVPDKLTLFNKGIKDSYNAEHYNNEVKRRTINMKLAAAIKLKFKSTDINFIVVKEDKEIPKMIKALDEIFGDTVSNNKLMILYSRIISLQQVKENL